MEQSCHDYQLVNCPVKHALLLLLAGCDSFFMVSGHVTRCDTGAPLVGVEVTLQLVRGISSAEDTAVYSEPDGAYEIALNEPSDATAQLELVKPGYFNVGAVIDGTPPESDNFCLAPAP